MINSKKPLEPGLNKLASMVRAAATARPVSIGNTEQMRHMVADLCRLLGDRVIQPPTEHIDDSAQIHLPPRMRQTLDALLMGDSEKQIARKLQISQHTVHVYVKGLYHRFGVCSRGELLSRFIQKQN